MSGAVEGVALQEALQRIERCMNQLIPNLPIEARRANTGAIVQVANDFADLRAFLTTPPARSYADGVEDAAKVAECAFDDRGRSRAGHHSEMDWTDGYRDATRAAAAAIRLLSQGEKADV